MGGGGEEGWALLNGNVLLYAWRRVNPRREEEEEGWDLRVKRDFDVEI